MNKAELVEAIANESKITKTDAEKILNALLDNITKELQKGSNILLVGFGRFTTKKKAARGGYNPQTGKRLRIAARIKVMFKAGTALDKAINA